MFEDMVVDELIEANPIALKRGELPKKKDKGPTWRGQATFTKDELLGLFFDPRIPEYRRMVYAGAFFIGRIGKWGARTFAHIDRTLQPQPGLLVATSFNRKKKRIKAVKSERPRRVPIHPLFAQLLKEWTEGGYPRTFGRSPPPSLTTSSPPLPAVAP